MAPDWKYCIVVDTGLCYTTYDKWIKRHFVDYEDNFEHGHSIADIKNGRVYRIIGHASHDDFDVELYLIQDMDTEQVFIIEEKGISKYGLCVSMKNTTTLRCDKLDTTISCDIKGGERDMNNKIVDLYYERKREEIRNKYKELLENEYNELEVVKEYNELVNTFEASLAELANRYNTEEDKKLLKTGYMGEYTYDLSPELKEVLRETHLEDFNKETKELELLVEEVRAVLSISDTDEYRLNVLTEYGIITKKGKLNI